MKTRIVVKTTFDEKDIIAGLYVIKNTSPLGSTDLGFACTVIYKIGFISTEKQSYCLISCMTDGMVFPIGTKLQISEKLNADDYRPLTKEEYIKIISSTDQGFLDY